MSNHGGAMSDILLPRSRFYHGPYGRMFRNLPPHEPVNGEETLKCLAAEMIEGDEAEDEAGDNPTIPAGYIYFGQFLTHDITFDPTSSLQRRNDPDKLYNFRTPRFDLDSLYGGGPDESPFLYDRHEPDKLQVDKRLNIRISRSEQEQEIRSFDELQKGDCIVKISKDLEEDLPRNSQGRALIGDMRNDENILISQMHLAFLKFHNQVVTNLTFPKNSPDRNLLAEAQRIVRWHYQWVVVHDFLKRIVGEETYNRILPSRETPGQPNLRFYDWNKQPFIPIEFSAAAFRFGHSMVRFKYRLNDELKGSFPIFPRRPEKDPQNDLRGFRRLPPEWSLQWSLFLDFNAPHKKNINLQFSRRINTKLSPRLHNLPFVSKIEKEDQEESNKQTKPTLASLAVRNLIRGWRMGLPSGQAVARKMGCCLPAALVFREELPLWYYILKEAELPKEEGGGGGEHLGPVGGTIVAEVIFGLLAGDPFSYLAMEPLWTPQNERSLKISDTDSCQFQLRDIVRYAQMPIYEEDLPF